MAPIGVIRVTGAADYSLALLRVQEPWALASPTGCILGHHAGALSTLSHPLAAPFLFFEQDSPFLHLHFLSYHDKIAQNRKIFLIFCFLIF